MGNKISQLSSQDILDKEFKTGLRGYQPDEVDKFLDEVIKDYQAFNKEIERLTLENQRLKQESSTQKTEPRRPIATQGQTNYDILKRLSNLEKHVFGSRLSD